MLLFLVAGASAFAPPPQLVVTQSTTSWNATLHFFDGTLRARAPPQQPHAALPPERRSPAGGASRAALSARQWLAQGFFEPWSPFPRSGMQRCAGDVTDTYIEIKKAMNEIGEQTTFLTFYNPHPSPEYSDPHPSPNSKHDHPTWPRPRPRRDPGFDSDPDPCRFDGGTRQTVFDALCICDDARRRQSGHQGPGQGVRQPEGAPPTPPATPLSPLHIPRPSHLAPRALLLAPLTTPLTPHLPPHLTSPLKASLVACKEHVAELDVAKLALALETGFEHPATFLFEYAVFGSGKLVSHTPTRALTVTPTRALTLAPTRTLTLTEPAP